MPHTDFARRLRSAVDATKLPHAEIAKQAGMPRQVLANMLAGSAPGHRHAPNLARTLNVSFEWLMTGTEAAIEEKVKLYALELAAGSEKERRLVYESLSKRAPASLRLNLNFEEQLALALGIKCALDSGGQRLSERQRKLLHSILSELADTYCPAGEHHGPEAQEPPDMTGVVLDWATKVSGAQHVYEKKRG